MCRLFDERVSLLCRVGFGKCCTGLRSELDAREDLGTAGQS